MLSRISARLALLAIALLLSAACGSDGGGEGIPPTGLELARLFPVAEIEAETSRIDFGLGAARYQLLTGWSHDETTTAGEPFVWGVGAASELELTLLRPRPLTLQLEGSAFQIGGQVQAVGVELNGHAVGTVTLGVEFGQHSLALPPAAQRYGVNLLRLAYAYHRPSSPPGVKPRQRALAVQWHALRLLEVGGESQARADAEAPESWIEVSPRQRVSFYLDLEPGSELYFAGLRAAPELGRQAALIVEVATAETADQPERIRLEIGEGAMRVPLLSGAGGRQTVRVSLAAEAGETGWRDSLSAAWQELWGDDLPPDVVRVLRPTVVQPPKPATTATVEPAMAGEQRPNIILYLIDTLRADHLGVYGYHRPTSPWIDSFSERATLFTNTQAQSSWTRAAVASIITGLNPQTHRVNGRLDALPEALDTLAEVLKSAGYSNFGWATNGNVDPKFGMHQGFDRYERMRESHNRPSVHYLSDQVNERVFKFLDSAEAEHQPFFLYIHVTDPHAPYAPPEPFRQRFAADADLELGTLDNVRAFAKGERQAPPGTRQSLLDLYDAEIAFNDHHFGRLIADLERRGLWDSALVILISDHGEEFLERGGWEHGRTLNGEQLRVPLIIKLPHGVGAGQRIDGLTRQVDVLPTVLDYLDLEAPRALDGRSLLAQMRGEGGNDIRGVSFSLLALDERVVEAAQAGGWKLIQDRSRRSAALGEELYRVFDDPTEQIDLKARHVFERGYLRQLLRTQRFASRQNREDSPPTAEIDAELEEQLRALGYLN